MLRSHSCGDLRKNHVGEKVALAGWVHSRRDHGGVLFFDLRDRSGLIQIVAHPEAAELFKLAETLRLEYVIRIQGSVTERPNGTENPKLPTGAVEVNIESLEILNQCPPLPFEISEYSHTSEEVRLSYRYLDLRRPELQRNLITRHKMTAAVRSLLDEEGFLEIETPFLTKSTPEGARDFLVPSRLSPGNFYALPQSPQLFKQILMVGGMDKYYQVARCFRDEDLRSDRQPEFTQIDLEMSFVDENDVIGVTERILQTAFQTATGKQAALPFPRISYKEAMDRFGSDKPDTRLGMEIVDLTAALSNCGFGVFKNAAAAGGVIKAIAVPGGGSFSRSEIDALTEYAKKLGAKGLAWMKWADQGAESNIVKFFAPQDLEAIAKTTGVQSGDIVFFGAGPWKSVCSLLGSVRLEVARRKNMFEAVRDRFEFLWVVDFPLLEWDAEENRWNAMHHPFTSPRQEDLDKLESAPGEILARAYDVVLNGTELGGGSVRIHQPQVQQRVFAALGIAPESAREKFGFLLDALSFGAPPHGGLALGLDRMVALFLGEDSIRDTIAFPKTQKGQCPLSGSPSEVAAKQLREIHIRVAVPNTPTAANKEPQPQS